MKVVLSCLHTNPPPKPSLTRPTLNLVRESPGHELWGADPECPFFVRTGRHYVYASNYGGVKCLYCRGWYCS